MYTFKKGDIDKSIYFFLRSTSTNPVGLGKTGLVFNSAGANCRYVRDRGLNTAITLVSLVGPDSAHSDGGFVEVSAANMPGLYRLDLPDAPIATGVDRVYVSIKFDGIFEEATKIDLTTDDVYAGGITDVQIADTVLKRDWTLVTGEGARSMLNAMRFLRNKWTIISSTLSVKKEDDASEAWSSALTGTQSGVTQSDPT